MRLVVTGAGGGLARAFLAQLAAHHEVTPFTHAELDVGDHDAVLRSVPALAPHVIVNLAAFTAVDANETEPARAWRDNALGPQSLALAARACDAWLLHVSTDYVFDGTKGSAYDEFDEPRPLSVYGRSKLSGERLVREAWWRHVIVRTGQLFGGGTDYVSVGIERLRSGEDVGGLIDRFGTPTAVDALAERLLPLVLAGRPGTYHVAGPERACWFDVLERARTLGGLAGSVREQRISDLGLAAARPADVPLTSVLLDLIGIDPMPPLEASLRALVDGRA
ncbi:MAG: NAD(P)-dependent oxidoreductase [Actinomycetota bacterium]